MKIDKGRRGMRRTALGTTIALLLFSGVARDAIAASARADDALRVARATDALRVARATVLHRGDAVTGALPMDTPIHIEVALKLRNKDVLDAFVADNARNQAKGRPAQLMTSAQVLANHAPTQQQAQGVADWLIGKGYTHVMIAPNRLLVSADGTAATARDAFMTSFAQVRTHDGRIAHANTDEVRVPAAMGDKILAVVGLQDVHLAKAGVSRADRTAVQAGYVMPHDPAEFSSIYRNPYQARNIPVGIVSSGSMGAHGGLIQAISDLNTYTAYHSLYAIPVDIVNTNGTSTTPGVDQAADLASQNIVGMAGGAVKALIFYNVPTASSANLTADFNTIVVANGTKVIEDSYGTCERHALNDGSAVAQDQILEVAVAQGQTFVVSNGSPGGADQCGDGGNTPRWPASSQYVVAVGGTVLNASATTWSSEHVYDGSGGSPSTFEPMPSWQSAFGVAGTTRVAVDVAFDAAPASGSKVIVNNVLTPLGGNALAASLFAGEWASLLESRGTTFGFAGPPLYAMPATVFHDLNLGSNDGGQPGVGYAAGTGYDFASGRGSVDAYLMFSSSAGLGNKPPVAAFTFSVNGLTANFQDASTDPDSAIASRVWDFGDGARAGGLHPRHSYASNGTYWVTETVKDSQGAAAGFVQSISIGPLQLLADPGFESCGFYTWTGVGDSFGEGLSIVERFRGPNPFVNSGRCAAAMKPNGQPISITQAAAIPGYKRSASLRFHLNIVPTTTTTSVTDTIHVRVNASNGTLLANLGDFTNLDATGGTTGAYNAYSFDMTPWVGQNVQIQFAGDSADTNQTAFYLDNVSLNAQ